MLLVIEILIISILALILASIVIDEVARRKSSHHLVRLRRFWVGRERRRVKRFNACLDVEYDIDVKTHPSDRHDISTEGVGLLLEEKLDRGTPLRMRIRIPEANASLRLEGEVAWTSEFRDNGDEAIRLFSTGIKFTDIPPKYEKALFAYIRNLERQQEPVGS